MISREESFGPPLKTPINNSLADGLSLKKKKMVETIFWQPPIGNVVITIEVFFLLFIPESFAVRTVETNKVM